MKSLKFFVEQVTLNENIFLDSAAKKVIVDKLAKVANKQQLDKLVNHEDDNVRSAVAKYSPYIDHLIKLGHDESPTVRRATASNPASIANSDLCGHLLSDEESYHLMVGTLDKNRYSNTEAHTKILSDFFNNKKTRTQDYVAGLIVHHPRHPDVDNAMVNNKGLHPNTLAMIARDPETSSSALDKLVDHPDEDIRKNVLANYNTSPHTHKYAFKNATESQRRDIASIYAHKFFNTGDTSSDTRDILNMAQKDDSSAVRLAALARRGDDKPSPDHEEFISRFVHDPHLIIRFKAVSYTENKDTLKKLSADPNEHVSAYAQIKLQHINNKEQNHQ